jgi:hypothetical protein
MRYKFPMFNTYNPDILYLREKGCQDLWFFIYNFLSSFFPKPKGVLEQKRLGNTGVLGHDTL